MNVTAVIAEYNPFHNGHLYQLDTIRQTHDADLIIVVMSGDFTQRGIPAIVDKYERCQMALENGADLVFELPVYFALGSAEYFAQGAVSLIDKLGVVDFLHFGSESGDIDLMYQFTNRMLANESDAYKAALNRYLKRGYSFPAARDRALSELLPADRFPTDAPVPKKTMQLVSAPNNILGLEYIKALIQRNSPIKPVTIKRKGGGYTSDSLDTDNFASANAIRNALLHPSEYVADSRFAQDIGLTQNIFPTVPPCALKHMPESVCTILHQKTFLCADNFSELLLYKMLQDKMLQDKMFQDKIPQDKNFQGKIPHNEISMDKLPKDAFAKYYDIGTQLSHTLYNYLPEYTTFEDFALSCKTKNLTYTRICRGLMHILLDMTQENADALKQDDYAQYARLLGFTERGRQLLKTIKANASIPIITKLPDVLRQLCGTALMSLRSDIYAADIYDGVSQQKQIRLSGIRSGQTGSLSRHNELTRQIVKHV